MKEKYMTARTFKFLAKAYGTKPAQITVLRDGSPLFSGALAPTESALVFPADPTTFEVEFDELFQFDVEIGTAIHSDITINVAGSDVLFGPVNMNYFPKSNPAVTSLPEYSAELNNLVSLAQERGLAPFIQDSAEWGTVTNDPKTNVKINNVAQTTIRDLVTPPLGGHWYWHVAAGSSFSCEFVFDNA
jgi:hypothetical protein